MLEPVIVTKAEEQQATDFENLTRDALKKKIFDQIILLDPSNEKLQEEVFNKSLSLNHFSQPRLMHLLNTSSCNFSFDESSNIIWSKIFFFNATFVRFSKSVLSLLFPSTQYLTSGASS